MSDVRAYAIRRTNTAPAFGEGFDSGYAEAIGAPWRSPWLDPDNIS